MIYSNCYCSKGGDYMVNSYDSKDNIIIIRFLKKMPPMDMKENDTAYNNLCPLDITKIEGRKFSLKFHKPIPFGMIKTKNGHISEIKTDYDLSSEEYQQTRKSWIKNLFKSNTDNPNQYFSNNESVIKVYFKNSVPMDIMKENGQLGNNWNTPLEIVKIEGRNFTFEFLEPLLLGNIVSHEGYIKQIKSVHDIYWDLIDQTHPRDTGVRKIKKLLHFS